MNKSIFIPKPCPHLQQQGSPSALLLVLNFTSLPLYPKGPRLQSSHQGFPR